MSKYIDADLLRKEIDKWEEAIADDNSNYSNGMRFTLRHIIFLLDSLQQEQDKMRYCIEYINPLHPLLDNGALNIRHLRVPDEHSAEIVLTLMLSFGAKIYALYRGNVKDGKLDEWQAPMIVDADDWYSTDWLHDILDCGCTL